MNAKIENGCTPLHVAASHGRIEVVKILLNNGADMNAKTEDGHTPLHWAASHGHTEIVKIFLNNGADMNAKTRWPYAFYGSL